MLRRLRERDESCSIAAPPVLLSALFLPARPRGRRSGPRLPGRRPARLASAIGA